MILRNNKPLIRYELAWSLLPHERQHLVEFFRNLKEWRREHVYKIRGPTWKVPHRQVVYLTRDGAVTRTLTVPQIYCALGHEKITAGNSDELFSLTVGSHATSVSAKACELHQLVLQAVLPH